MCFFSFTLGLLEMSASTMTNMIQTQGLSEETMMLMQKKQGIVTILGDTYTASASSLRRTLSADMSSKKWLCPQNDSSPTMKKIASSEELSHHHPKTIANSLSSSSSSEVEEDYEERKKLETEAEAEAERERLEIWSSIQKNKKEEQEKSGPFDTWGSIMSLKGNNNNNNLEISKSLPVTVTPYVHPLVKRSKSSSLSEKSLEICTESLGSETGSDGLLFSSSYPPSESGESEVDKDKEQKQEVEEEEEEKVSESACDEEWLLQVPRYNNHVAATTKNKSPPRSLPPPLPSLSFQANSKGSSLHMRPHRDNGRLILQAVSLRSQNNFNAQRQDGRLVLTFTNDADDEVEEENYDDDDDEGVEEELEEEFEGFEGEEEEEDEDECEGEYDDDESEVEEVEGEVGDVESLIEKAPLMSSGITTTTSVHRLALMMNKPIGLVNRNPNWPEKFNNKGVNLEDVSVVEMEPSDAAVAQSLPPRPRVARLIPSAAAQALASAAASSFNFNAYEYYWRTKPTAKPAQVSNPLAHHQSNNNNNNSPHKNNNSSKAIVYGGDMSQIYNEQQQLLVLRGKNGDYLVHNLKSCKDSRRPFLFWEPYCIATS